MFKKLSYIILLSCMMSLSFLSLTAQDTQTPVPTEIVTASDANHSNNDTELHNDLPIWIVAVGVVLALAATGGAYTYFRDSHTWLDYAVALAMAMTGFIHVTIGLLGDDLLFLNGAGFVILAGIRFIPQLQGRRMVMIVLNIGIMIYTGITIYGYFATHTVFDTLGIITKIVEFLLLALLMMHLIKQINFTSTSP